jgi:hypothetical protein
MPALDDVLANQTARAADVQQLVEMWSARRNTPAALLVTDPISYALTVRNTDPGSRTIEILASDGSTVLLQVDANGVKVSSDGTAAVAPLTRLGASAGAAAEGSHVHGAGGYSSLPGITLESIFASSWTTVSANYVVASGIMWVFCAAGITVTLPAAGSTNRPITVAAVAGSTTVNTAGGGLSGGSVNTSTGAVMNGVVSPGDSITWKSDGSNWRAV